MLECCLHRFDVLAIQQGAAAFRSILSTNNFVNYIIADFRNISYRVGKSRKLSSHIHIHIHIHICILLDCAKNSDIEDLMAELTILKEVNKIPHPNVVRFIGGCSIQGIGVVFIRLRGRISFPTYFQKN